MKKGSVFDRARPQLFACRYERTGVREHDADTTSAEMIIGNDSWTRPDESSAGQDGRTAKRRRSTQARARRADN